MMSLITRYQKAHNTLKQAKEDDSGFTLAEVVIAIIIVGILAGVVLPIFVFVLNTSVDQPSKIDTKNIANQMQTLISDNNCEDIATAIESFSGFDYSYEDSFGNTQYISFNIIHDFDCNEINNRDEEHSVIYLDMEAFNTETMEIIYDTSFSVIITAEEEEDDE